MVWGPQPRSKGLYCQPCSGNPQPCMRAQGKVGKHHRSQTKQPFLQGAPHAWYVLLAADRGRHTSALGCTAMSNPLALASLRIPGSREAQ